jgi:signal transduction histidine kinase
MRDALPEGEMEKHLLARRDVLDDANRLDLPIATTTQISTVAPRAGGQNQSLLTLAAIMTWAAVVLSEWFSDKGSTALHRPLFISAALCFMAAFLICDRQATRRGWSVALGVQTLSAMVAVYLGGFGLSPALYVILGTQLYERLPRAHVGYVLGILNAWLLYRLQIGTSWSWALSGLTAYGGFQLFGLAMAVNAKALSVANENLMASNAELSAAHALLDETARATERLHLSRELHDVCGHKLTALKLTLRAAVKAGSLHGVQLATTHALTDELLQDIRGVVSQLRAHDGIDLAAALSSLAHAWQTPKVDFDAAHPVRLPNLSVALVLLRVAQEAVTNAAKHAQASRVLIQLNADASGICLTITDDGSGRLPFVQGNGLLGMHERLRELGGALSLHQRARGICLETRVPLA